MLRLVKIKYHIVASDSADLKFPKEDLALVFRSASVELQLIPGTPIPVEPLHASLDKYPKLVERYAANERDAGHLILGLRPTRPDAAGELLDTTSRGVAAVFRTSYYIQQNGPAGYLQTCAHEIGHMLNLGHSDVSDDFTSVMDSADARSAQSAEHAWLAAEAEAASEHDNYYVHPSKPLPCHPFAYKARLALNTALELRFQPWGSTYDHSHDGVDDQFVKRSR